MQGCGHACALAAQHLPTAPSTSNECTGNALKGMLPCKNLAMHAPWLHQADKVPDADLTFSATPLGVLVPMGQPSSSMLYCSSIFMSRRLLSMR